MRKSIVTFLIGLAVSAAASAQQPEVIEHTPLACIRANQMPLLQANVTQEGELRVYFRRVGASDWCYVIGTNEGRLSRAALPKFDSGTEIEYFFVLLEGKQIVARSPQVYRTRATDGCDNIFARNSISLAMECAPNTASSIPAALGAGYALRSSAEVDSPFTPNN